MHFILPNACLVTLENLRGFLRLKKDCGMRTVVNRITIYAPMSYTAPCIMFWMRGYPLLGQVGGGWALGFDSFLRPA
jgi:hypothetical protein